MNRAVLRNLSLICGACLLLATFYIAPYRMNIGAAWAIWAVAMFVVIGCFALAYSALRATAERRYADTLILTFVAFPALAIAAMVVMAAIATGDFTLLPRAVIQVNDFRMSDLYMPLLGAFAILAALFYVGMHAVRRAPAEPAA